MNIIKNTLRSQWNLWSDPGDYPSGAGGYALGSFRYVEEIFGCVKIELADVELFVLHIAILDECIGDWVKQLELDMPDGVSSVQWAVKVEGRIVTLTVEEFVSDPDCSRELCY